MLKFQLLLSIPSIISAVKKEKQLVAEIINKENLVGIISDNRFGVYSSKIPSVYITHQLNVLSGFTTFLTSKIHQKIIKKFTECWVPDVECEQNVSGKLGRLKSHNFTIKYIGVLSRFKKQEIALKYDLTVLLSGPEPQRTLLENKLLSELKNYVGNVLFIRGVLNDNETISVAKNIKIVNYLLANELETALNESNLILARSGYSTIMDLAVLGKKAFFIPTPGQNEQEYLAKLCQLRKIAPFVKQKDFNLKKLEVLEEFEGFKQVETELDFGLFQLF
ncbi:glycosyltransferase [Lutibacter sp.]|uniref:glycosyltransferase n=1 Tax=Lutibacter sp. TaxID=1925666 RepID=UPI0035637E77